MICWFNGDVVVRSISLSLGPFSEPCLVVCRCANCFDCPCCMHTLSTRATSIPAPLPDDPAKTTMKKAYYLACGFCRWTSRDVGMADKSVGKGQLKGRILSYCTSPVCVLKVTDNRVSSWLYYRLGICLGLELQLKIHMKSLCCWTLIWRAELS